MKAVKMPILFLLILLNFFCCDKNAKKNQFIQNSFNEIESLENFEKREFYFYKSEKNKLMISDLSKNSNDEIKLECILLEDKTIMVPAEDLFTFLNKTYEFCGRCGNISVNLSNKKNDILLIEWNSPYVLFQNREDKIILPHKNFFEDGKTFTDFILFSKIEF